MAFRGRSKDLKLRSDHLPLSSYHLKLTGRDLPRNVAASHAEVRPRPLETIDSMVFKLIGANVTLAAVRKATSTPRDPRMPCPRRCGQRLDTRCSAPPRPRRGTARSGGVIRRPGSSDRRRREKA